MILQRLWDLLFLPDPQKTCGYTQYLRWCQSAEHILDQPYCLPGDFYRVWEKAQPLWKHYQDDPEQVDEVLRNRFVNNYDKLNTLHQKKQKSRQNQVDFELLKRSVRLGNVFTSTKSRRV